MKLIKIRNKRGQYETQECLSQAETFETLGIPYTKRNLKILVKLRLGYVQTQKKGRLNYSYKIDPALILGVDFVYFNARVFITQEGLTNLNNFKNKFSFD